jgi:hypothetical protein
MTGFTDYWSRKVLDHSVGKTSVGGLPSINLALFIATGTDSGTGFTEMSGAGYTRVTTSGSGWNAAGGSSPSTNSNLTDIIWPSASSAWGTILAVGAYDALNAGNLLWWDYLGNFPWLPFTCSSATPGVITCPQHGYSAGDTVVVSTEYGGTLPNTAGSWAGLLTAASAGTDTFNVGINTTSTGNGTVRKVTGIAVSAGQAPRLAGGTPGNLVLSLA